MFLFQIRGKAEINEHKEFVKEQRKDIDQKIKDPYVQESIRLNYLQLDSGEKREKLTTGTLRDNTYVKTGLDDPVWGLCLKYRLPYVYQQMLYGILDNLSNRVGELFSSTTESPSLSQKNLNFDRHSDYFERIAASMGEMLHNLSSLGDEELAASYWAYGILRDLQGSGGWDLPPEWIFSEMAALVAECCSEGHPKERAKEVLSTLNHWMSMPGSSKLSLADKMSLIMTTAGLLKIKPQITDNELFDAMSRIPVLFQALGIENPERYTPRLLADTYLVLTEKGYLKQGDNLSLITYPSSLSDYNRAFSNDGPILEKLLDNGNHVIICQAKTDFEAVERLKNFGLSKYDRGLCVLEGNPRYKNWIVGGHGDQFNLTFDQDSGQQNRNVFLTSKEEPGAPKQRDDFQFGKLDAWDFKRLGGAGALQGYFMEDSTVLLVSCSTGKETEAKDAKGGFENLAHMLSSLTGVGKVIAPDDDSSLLSISFDGEGRITGAIHFGASNKEYSGHKER